MMQIPKPSYHRVEKIRVNPLLLVEGRCAALAEVGLCGLGLGNTLGEESSILVLR